MSVKAVVVGVGLILGRWEAEEGSCSDHLWYGKRRLQSSDNVTFNLLAKEY